MLKKIRFEEEIRLKKMARLTVMSLEDWSRVDVKEIRERWEKRRKELDEIERKKTEREKRIEEAKKRKEEKRKRAIRERRYFVCGIFGHMARYCRNREEKRGSLMPQNKFEVLKDRVMQRGEGSGKEVGKDRKEILKEERVKKGKTKVEKTKIEKKEKTREVEEKDEKIEEEREVEIRGFSGGEILKGRYPLAWWKVRCYECGGLGHRKRDHREKEKDKIGDKKINKEIAREEKKTEEKERKERKDEDEDEDDRKERDRNRDRDSGREKREERYGDSDRGKDRREVR